VLRIPKDAGEEPGLWQATLTCESRIENTSGPHLLRKLTMWWMNFKKALRYVQVDRPITRTVFASISPGGCPNTFVPLQRLLLTQVPSRVTNEGPLIVTGLIILTQEQPLKMELICAALATQLRTVHMKIAESSSPVGDGSQVQRVFLTFTADKSFREDESVGIVQKKPDGP
jgi:hypothetical protein